jgi:hypothetical protein
MDILNWVYLIKNKFTRTTVENPATDLIVLGADVSYQKRGDKYQNYVMTVEDFAASLPAPAPTYKVYTALLTQSGGDNPQSLTSGAVTKGVTYMIDGVDETADFSNVGAPNNNVNTWFIATTNEVPNSYGGGSLYYNIGAPVVTVLENTLGNVWFTFLGNGVYGINNTNEWDITKVWYGTSGIGDSGSINVNPGRTTMSFEGTSFIIVCYNNDYTSAINGQLINTPIEIRVYN